MLASLLPGLRSIRAPLAAGYVLLVAAWLALAPMLLSRRTATGVLADLYSLYSEVGKVGAFAAVTFIAYLIGLVTVELAKLTASLFGGVAWQTYKILPERYKGGPRKIARPFLNLEGPTRTARRHTIRAIIVGRLSRRLEEDPRFREQIAAHLSRLQDDARSFGIPLPDRLGEMPADMLADELEHRDSTRTRVLLRIVDLRPYADDLMSSLRYTGGAAAATSDIREDQDRSRAEGDFRVGLALPIMMLALVLAYRTSPWFLAGAALAAWLLYIGNCAYAEANTAVLRAIAEGRVTWPPAERPSGKPVYYRSFPQVVRRWPLPAPRPKASAEPAEARVSTPAQS